MRTALRTPIVTAALAGALLAPAATALAAPAPQAVTSVAAVTSMTTVSAASAVSGDGSGNDRYDGEKILVAKSRLAVLRNGAEGPEVWIRAVAADWKPGDGWAGRVLAKLDPAHRRAVLEGVQYELKELGSGPYEGRYGFDVRVLGEDASRGSYILPKPARAAEPARQTAVIPMGSVAAGAEIASADTDNTTTAAAGTALIAIFAGLGSTLLVQARRARTRG
ncbi:hypothetical protein [Streptomyces sp. NBC_01264]|uniref:hypothetical protein n=1 Tax=Streptomyces sp. NBC_01264 TaxID=2903804 RepID=UPI0022564B1F|nr:hypothetical protein [Streptomyces sp. NBC_01264]MCX4779641.1 hypothetical protein [Streptomyces sp. NBC_01264]